VGLIDLSSYLWPEDVTGRLPRLGRRFDPTHRLNSNTTYTLYGGELYGPNNQSLAVPPLEAGLTVGIGTGGIGLANSGASANGLNYGLPGRYLSDTGGVFHVTTTVTLTGASSICSVWGSAPEHYQHVFSVGADGSIVFGIYYDYSNVHIKSAPVGTVPMGRATTISAYWQAGVGILIAVDGKLCTSYSNVWVQGNPASVAWVGQCWGGKLKIFAGASGTLHYLKIQNAVRTTKDLIEISRNPNELFEPLPDLPFSLSAVGSGTTTVISDSAASYKVQGSVQSSSVAAYGIRSAIQSDSVASYAIRAAIQSSSVAAYGIRSAIQSSAASGYNIRAAIQQDAPGSYRIRGLTQQSSTLAYGIRGLVDQAIAASYAVRGAVSSDASATYSILSATSVSASASAGYSIRGSIQQSSAASYSLRGSVTQDTSATYSIRGSINQDTAAIYALRGSVTQDTSAAYNILSASAVSSSVTAGYAIKGSVQSSIVAGYSIAQAVQAEIAASYIIRSGVVSEAQAAYVILGLVYQSIAASYVVDGGLFSGPIIPRLTRLSALTQRVDQLSIITRNVMLCSTIGAGE
jgi:hypothetical protein